MWVYLSISLFLPLSLSLSLSLSLFPLCVCVCMCVCGSPVCLCPSLILMMCSMVGTYGMILTSFATPDLYLHGGECFGSCTLVFPCCRGVLRRSFTRVTLCVCQCLCTCAYLPTASPGHACLPRQAHVCRQIREGIMSPRHMCAGKIVKV
jgi:hypothetical protein